MTQLHKTINKVLPKEGRTPLDKKIAKENIRTHESLDKRMNPEMPAVDDTVIPLPDEEELERVRRRRARGGGRASTVLTSDEGLGG
jgi:hypothetical protein